MAGRDALSFFFKNFLVRYLRYRLLNGIVETTLSLYWPVRGGNLPISSVALRLNSARLRRTVSLNLDLVAELARPVLDLDPVVQELFERGAVEDAVRGRLLKVDDELERLGGRSRLARRRAGLHVCLSKENRYRQKHGRGT